VTAAGSVLTTRQLNRALLARQGLLDRWNLPIEEVLSRLVGLQAQAPQAPHGCLWARMTDFQPQQLDELLIERRAVRVALMRSTLFLVTARDCLQLRPVMAPAGLRQVAATAAKRASGVDLARLIDRSRALLADDALTFAELGAALAAEFPPSAAADLSSLARVHIPLVQIPPRGLWGRSGPARHRTVADWLGAAYDDSVEGAEQQPNQAILRYLRAFGPATIADVQAWSGLTGLRSAVAGLREELEVFKDERGRELFDVPDGLFEDPDRPAPARILGEFDNALLSHADRSRIFDDEHRRQFMTENGLVRATLLIDGFVAGSCARISANGVTTLTIIPFHRLSQPDADAAQSEGERLLRLSAPGTAHRIVMRGESEPSKTF
jgi:hypothetical protein